MAKNRHTEHTDYNSVRVAPSHGWVCNACGKELVLTEEEIEKLERPRPHTKPEDWDYYMPCPFCKTGEIQQPTFSLTEALQAIDECEG